MSERDPGEAGGAPRALPKDAWASTASPDARAFAAAAPHDILGFAPAAAPDIAPERLADLAHRIYKARRHRSAYLNISLFGEPAWDMLLALYCHSAEAPPLSISGLCYAADVPVTTALRWSNLLEQKKLIVRSRDRSDARRAHVTLSDKGHALMSAYLATIFEKVLGAKVPLE